MEKLTRRIFSHDLMVGALLVIASVGTTIGATPHDALLGRFYFEEPHLGTTVSFTVYAPDSRIANQAAQAAYDEVRRLNAIFSTYESKSELIALHENLRRQSAELAGQPPLPLALSDDLFDVLGHSLDISRQTLGAFDVTVGPYARIWKRAIRRDALPQPSRLAAAAHAVGHEKVQLDPATKSVHFSQTTPPMRLDFSGIAKGYIADRAHGVFSDHNLPVVLVDAGGDLSVGDPPPGKVGWEIEVQHGSDSSEPHRQHRPLKICLRNAGVATSGDAFQRLKIGGTRYSHIIDPRTGAAVTHGLAVTVIADRAMTADALASAASVAGPTGSRRIFESYPNLAYLFVSDSQSQLHGDGELARFCGQIAKHNRSAADK